MAAMTGSEFYLDFGAVVLDGEYRTFTATETSGIVDKSAGADAARTYLTTLKDGTASLSVVMLTGSAGTQIWKAMVPGTAGSLVWSEEGSQAGTASHAVYAIVTERRKTIAYADLIMADVTWQFSGTVVDSAFA